MNLEAHVEDSILCFNYIACQVRRKIISCFTASRAQTMVKLTLQDQILHVCVTNNNRTRPKCINPPAVTMYKFYSVMRSSFTCQWAGHLFKRRALKKCFFFKALDCVHFIRKDSCKSLSYSKHSDVRIDRGN